MPVAAVQLEEQLTPDPKLKGSDPASADIWRTSRGKAFLSFIFSSCDSPTYQSKMVHWWQGPKETAGYQGCSQICPWYWRHEEAPLLPPRYSRSLRNLLLPEVHWTPHPQAALPVSCQINCPGLQDWPLLPVLCCHGSSGGIWSIPCWYFWIRLRKIADCCKINLKFMLFKWIGTFS